jgi:hypothetical protein
VEKTISDSSCFRANFALNFSQNVLLALSEDLADFELRTLQHQQTTRSSYCYSVSSGFISPAVDTDEFSIFSTLET